MPIPRRILTILLLVAVLSATFLPSAYALYKIEDQVTVPEGENVNVLTTNNIGYGIAILEVDDPDNPQEGCVWFALKTGNYNLYTSLGSVELHVSSDSTYFSINSIGGVFNNIPVIEEGNFLITRYPICSSTFLGYLGYTTLNYLEVSSRRYYYWEGTYYQGRTNNATAPNTGITVNPDDYIVIIYERGSRYYYRIDSTKLDDISLNHVPVFQFSRQYYLLLPHNSKLYLISTSTLNFYNPYQDISTMCNGTYCSAFEIPPNYIVNGVIHALHSKDRYRFGIPFYFYGDSVHFVNGNASITLTNSDTSYVGSVTVDEFASVFKNTPFNYGIYPSYHYNLGIIPYSSVFYVDLSQPINESQLPIGKINTTATISLGSYPATETATGIEIDPLKLLHSLTSRLSDAITLVFSVFTLSFQYVSHFITSLTSLITSATTFLSVLPSPLSEVMSVLVYGLLGYFALRFSVWLIGIIRGVST